MDKTAKLFDVWANTGRSEDMEKGHGTTVNQFLDKLPLKENFTFLDIGCGNGWVVRKISQKLSCIKAVGIDKSKMMIKNAKSKTEKRLTTLKNGSVRTMIPMGHLEKVTPIDILTTPLIKAILSYDIDTMEKLGIYECAPEDVALCTFVDASKMNISTIIQEGLDFIDAEG